MTTKPEVSKESVVLLCKGGYLPSRDHLTPDEREANKEHHVELMLRTAREHRMRRLEGFQFVAPPQPWERFWIVEFPEFEGAEAYAEAEMALPSGPHAYHEYYMARRWGREYYDAWVANPREPIAPLPDAPDMRNLPVTEADLGSVVVLEFARWIPEAGPVVVSEEDRAKYELGMKTVARNHGLMALEAYKFVVPQAGWSQFWMAEFPDQAGAEAWIDAEHASFGGGYGFKFIQLAHRWFPEYFATWVPR